MATKKKQASSSGARSAHTLEEANEVGFFGQEVDPTPDENYTVAGQLAGKPTPETDEELAAEARQSAGLAKAGDAE